MSGTPILEAKNITKLYDLDGDKITAIDNVSVTVGKGEFVAISGKSGSGKSTLMHIIGLLDTPTFGELLLNNIRINTFNERQLARLRNKEIGFIFQSFNLLARVTSIENVMLPLQYSDTPRKQWLNKAVAMLKLVDLGDRLNNKSNELSGGQKQRVAIARALVNDPSIILADEPTGNLDTKTGREIELLFKKLNDQGKTIIIVTHDEDLASIAKRKIILMDGRIINDTGA